MWVFTTKGFLSIVQHKDMTDYFQIKSRARAPLEELWPDHEILVIDWADYRFRINIRKGDAIPVIAKEVEQVLYTSFKNECWEDVAYHHALTSIWSTMYNFQTLSETKINLQSGR
mgnify:CR=1 FL=1